MSICRQVAHTSACTALQMASEQNILSDGMNCASGSNTAFRTGAREPRNCETCSEEGVDDNVVMYMQ